MVGLLIALTCSDRHHPFTTPAVLEEAEVPWGCEGLRVTEHRPIDAGLVARDAQALLYDDSVRRSDRQWLLEGAGRALASDGDTIWVATHRGVELLAPNAHRRWATGGSPVAITADRGLAWVADHDGRVLTFDANGLRDEHLVDGWPRSVATLGDGAVVGRTHLPPLGIGVEVPSWVGTTPWLAGDDEGLWAVQDDALLLDGELVTPLAGRLVSLTVDAGQPLVHLADGSMVRWEDGELHTLRSGPDGLMDLAEGPVALAANGSLHGGEPALTVPDARAILRHRDELLVATGSGILRLDAPAVPWALEGVSVQALAASGDLLYAWAPDLGVVEVDPDDGGIARLYPPDPRRVVCALSTYDGQPALTFLALPGVARGGSPWRTTSLAGLARSGQACATVRDLHDDLYVPLPGYGLERLSDARRWRFHPGGWDVARLGDRLIVARGTAGVISLDDDEQLPCSLPGTIEKLVAHDHHLVAMGRSALTTLARD